MPLTKRLIDAVKHPDHGQVFLRDDALRGFGLRITAGSKVFILERKIHGQSRRIVLGHYGDLTVDQARALAHERIVEIQKGRDPAAERKQRRQQPTFGELSDMYLARHAALKKSKQNDDGILRNHLSHWRHRTLSSIKREDVARLHTKIGTTPSSVIRPGKPVAVPMPRAANAVLSLLRCMFNLAEDWGLHPGPNPCVRIKKFPELSRDRFVQPAELPKLWAAIQAEKNPYVRTAFFTALLTGARRDEVLTMRWTDLDTTQAVWRIPTTKAGRPHMIPLPRPALEEILKLPRMAETPYVFPGRWGRGHLVNISKPWNRIKNAAGLADVRIHDLRRTLGSWLVGAGASLPLIGKALNHSSVSTTAIYSRLQLDPVRAALDANAEKMLGMVKQEKQDAER